MKDFNPREYYDSSYLTVIKSYLYSAKGYNNASFFNELIDHQVNKIDNPVGKELYYFKLKDVAFIMDQFFRFPSMSSELRSRINLSIKEYKFPSKSIIKVNCCDPFNPNGTYAYLRDYDIDSYIYFTERFRALLYSSKRDKIAIEIIHPPTEDGDLIGEFIVQAGLVMIQFLINNPHVKIYYSFDGAEDPFILELVELLEYTFWKISADVFYTFDEYEMMSRKDSAILKHQLTPKYNYAVFNKKELKEFLYEYLKIDVETKNIIAYLGGSWLIIFEGTEFWLADSVFIKTYAYIIAKPEQEICISDIYKLLEKDDDKDLIRNITTNKERFIRDLKNISGSDDFVQYVKNSFHTKQKDDNAIYFSNPPGKNAWLQPILPSYLHPDFLLGQDSE